MTAVFIGDDARTEVSALDRIRSHTIERCGTHGLARRALPGPPRLPVHRARITSARAAVVFRAIGACALSWCGISHEAGR